MAGKFCPKCGSSEFRQTAVVVKEDNPTLVHKLFYWNYDGYYMLAKSKLAGITSFIFFASMVFLAGAPPMMFLFGAVIGALVFLLGIGLHNLVSKPSKAKREYNDYGFITDLKHFLLFWQDKKNWPIRAFKNKSYFPFGIHALCNYCIIHAFGTKYLFNNTIRTLL
jgi:predicted nucleic-acid-binding Zn-ribbon protein